MPFFFAFAILLVIAAVFLKFLLFDPARVKKLFAELKLRGYYDIDPKDSDLNSKIRRLFWKTSESDSLTVLQAIAHRQDNSCIYLCDIHYFYSVADEGRNQYYTMLAVSKPVDIKTDTYIHRRLPAFVQNIFNLFTIKDRLVKITEGLNNDFSERFFVFAKRGSNIVLSGALQGELLNCSFHFPLNRTTGNLAMIHISPEGWSLIYPRVGDKGHLDMLLKTAEAISRAL